MVSERERGTREYKSASRRCADCHSVSSIDASSKKQANQSQPNNDNDDEDDDEHPEFRHRRCHGPLLRHPHGERLPWSGRDHLGGPVQVPGMKTTRSFNVELLSAASPTTTTTTPASITTTTTTTTAKTTKPKSRSERSRIPRCRSASRRLDVTLVKCPPHSKVQRMPPAVFRNNLQCLAVPYSHSQCLAVTS